MVAEGIADPERVCIVGASYGGYAVLAGAAFTPELYRCAAAMLEWRICATCWLSRRDSAGGRSATVAYWRQVMGLKEGSPTRT